MLSDREIADLWSWAAAQDQGPETTQQHAFARAVERAAYELAAQECEDVENNGPLSLIYDDACADCARAIRKLGRQR